MHNHFLSPAISMILSEDSYSFNQHHTANWNGKRLRNDASSVSQNRSIDVFSGEQIAKETPRRCTAPTNE